MDAGRRHLNGVKTAALFGVMWAVLLGIGALVANGTGSGAFIWLFALIGLGTTFYSYWNSDKIAIRAMGARPVSEAEAPAMYRIVRELSTAARQPMPRLYISPTMQPNAFATGRNPRNAAVCCTAGILQILDERELRGVLGNSLLQGTNPAIFTPSVPRPTAGPITSPAQFLLSSAGRARQGGGTILAVLATALRPPT